MPTLDSDEVHIVEKECNQIPDNYNSIGASSDSPSPYNNTFPKDPDFTKCVREVELGLDADIKPKLSIQGTSGCYFVYDKQRVSTFK